MEQFLLGLLAYGIGYALIQNIIYLWKTRVKK